MNTHTLSSFILNKKKILNYVKRLLAKKKKKMNRIKGDGTTGSR